MTRWDFVQGGLMLILAALLIFFILAYIGSLYTEGTKRAEKIGMLFATIGMCIVYVICYIFAYII